MYLHYVIINFNYFIEIKTQILDRRSFITWTPIEIYIDCRTNGTYIKRVGNENIITTICIEEQKQTKCQHVGSCIGKSFYAGDR